LKLLSETRQTVLEETALGDTLGNKTSQYIYADTGSYEPLARVDTVALKTAQNDDAFAIKTGANLAIDTSAGEDELTNSASKTAKIFYFHNDLNGLPQELSQDGKFVWRASYKVWGNVVSEEWTGSYAKSSVKAQFALQPKSQKIDAFHYNIYKKFNHALTIKSSPSYLHSFP
jgi:RHS protein